MQQLALAMERPPQPNDGPPDGVYRPDPERVRSRLVKILAEAPWPAERLSLYRTIVPQMTGCLPAEEAADIVAEFTRLAAMQRLA